MWWIGKVAELSKFGKFNFSHLVQLICISLWAKNFASIVLEVENIQQIKGVFFKKKILPFGCYLYLLYTGRYLNVHEMFSRKSSERLMYVKYTFCFHRVMLKSCRWLRSAHVFLLFLIYDLLISKFIIWYLR